MVMVLFKWQTQFIKQREQPQQPQQQLPHMQMQQLLLRRHAQQQQQQQQQQSQPPPQQQRRDGAHLLNGTSNGLVGSDPLMQQPGTTANAMASKMYEKRLKLPLQRDPLDDAAMKQRFGENVGQLLDSNHASLLKSATASGQPSGQVLHATAGGMSPQVQARSQQLSGSTPDIKPEINPVLNPRAPGPEGSLIGIPGSNQGGNNLTLKGWPLTGLDELRSGILQEQKSPSASEDSRRLRMLLRRKHEDMVKDGYEDITNIDISLVAVDMTRRKHEDIP